MRSIRIILVLIAMLSTQAVFADDAPDMSSDSKPCAAIAKACLDAGYVRMKSASKRFWQDCMNPILLGKTVEGVTVDADTVKTCRANKIDQLKKELNDLQNVS